MYLWEVTDRRCLVKEGKTAEYEGCADISKRRFKESWHLLLIGKCLRQHLKLPLRFGEAGKPRELVCQTFLLLAHRVLANLRSPNVIRESVDRLIVLVNDSLMHVRGRSIAALRVTLEEF
nr:hypothetical protein CFP56_21719 [Quercus suber]